MKKIIFLLLLISPSLFPQEKYFIYFTDKGIKEGEKLNKTSMQYSEARNSLSERAIERRKKVLGDNYILFQDISISQSYIDQITSLGIKIENRLKWFNAVTAYMDNDQAALLKKFSFIKKIEPVVVISYRKEVSEPLQSLSKITNYNYGRSFTQLTMSDIPAVHAKGITGQGVLIGFLDTGFDWKRHESLMNADVLMEHDFVQGDSITANQEGDRPDQDEHGTIVFSTVAGYKDSMLIGAAFGASFILSKTEDNRSETHVEEDNYAAAMEWMESQGVDITTGSLGYNTFDSGNSYTYNDMNGNTTIVTKAVKHAFSLGVVTLSSAGNEGCNSPNQCWYYVTAPADENNIITVGAVNSNNEVTDYSSRGPTSDGRIKPDLVALGNGVFGAVSGTVSQYTTNNGTSLSTPLVCGVAGLLLSSFPHLTNIQVRSIMQMSGDNYSAPNNLRGYGLISARNAVNLPNIKYVNTSDTYIINKFLFPDKINPESVKVTFIKDNDSVTYSMNNYEAFLYSSNIPLMNFNEKLSIYFTYSDSLGVTYREPSAPGLTYTYFYGSNIVSPAGTIVSPVDYGILAQNYPNPFNNETQIKFLSTPGQRAEIKIYNSLGKKVKTLIVPNTATGYNIIKWDGRNDSGVTAASGVYIYQLLINGSLYSKKMLMLK